MTSSRTRQFKHVLLASAATLACAAAPEAAEAQAANQTPAAANPSSVSSDQIIITGTRRTDRTVTNSPSPIDVISSAEIKNQPTTSLLDTVKNVVPSFFVPQNTISDASSFVRAPSLRGLPGDEVLVQVNGKRYNRSALVQVYTGGDTGLSFGSQGADISSIPAIAIKNLQVLRDGATAQYGSDAIAGVMNFTLRDDRGVELEARTGQYFDHGNTTVTDGLSQQVAANVGVGIGATGFINVSGEYYSDDGTSRGATRPIAAIFAQRFPNLASLLPNYPYPAQLWGSSPAHGWRAALNSGVNVTSNSKLYLTLVGANNFANESFNYRPNIRATAVDVAGNVHTLSPNGAFANPFYLTPCPAGNATCPAGGFVEDSNTFSFNSWYPAGFTPRFVGVTRQRWGTVGYKGGDAGRGFTWDLSGTLAKNTLTLSMYDSLSPSYGPLSQRSFHFGQLSQKEKNLNADFTYPVNVGFFSPLTVAWGAEYRQETYGQSAGDLQSYGAGPFAAPQALYIQTSPGVYVFDRNISGRSPGASGYGGTSPQAAGSWSQKSWGLYGDLEADITQQLTMGVAGRYEHYNTFGGSFVYKVNALYKVIPELSVRGTIGTGFHAPSPGQSHDEILTTNFVAGNQVQTGTYPVDSPIAQYFGATTLKPEKSHNYGAGIIFKPMRTLTLTVDGYIINVKDRIGISQNFPPNGVSAADIAAQPALAAVGIGGQINYFTNGFNTSTKGIDAVGTWNTHFLGGSMSWTLAYNYNKSKVTSFKPGVISEAQRIDVAHLAPNNRAVLSTNWMSGPWTINARENYYGWWEDAVDYPTAQDPQTGEFTAAQKFGARFTTDLDVSYTLWDRLTLTLGANNIFNTYPTKIANSRFNPIYVLTGSTADGQIYPRPGGPFGINGGFWYIRARFKY